MVEIYKNLNIHLKTYFTNEELDDLDNLKNLINNNKSIREIREIYREKQLRILKSFEKKHYNDT